MRKALKPGITIEWNNIRAEVVLDAGGDNLFVISGHILQEWKWSSCGHECKVVESANLDVVI